MPRISKTHDPEAKPIGCNGKYGQSGYKTHRRRGEDVCSKCNRSKNHYQREVRRGQTYPHRLRPCGTKAAAVRHRKLGEALDFACRVAEAADNAERRTARLMGVHQ